MKKLVVLSILFITLSAHELFLKTDSHFIEPDSNVELFLFNGTFDQGESIITRDRIIDPKILGPGFRFIPDSADYYDVETVTYLSFKTGNPGTYVGGISTQPRVIELSSADFLAYLEHEGLEDVIDERKRKGIADQPAREKYSKHVKTLLQVGKTLSGDYAEPMDYPIEFIPLKNPYELSVGDLLPFQLLFQGRPLKNQVVHYSFRNQGDNTTERSTRTDKNGKLRIKLKESGKWYIATIHMAESPKEGLDYESNWATLTFEVK